MVVLVNGYARGEKCERCKEEHPEIFEQCNGTDASCTNFDE